MEYAVQIISSLAWPIAVIIVVSMLREPLVSLVSAVSGTVSRLRSLALGQAKLDVDSQLKDGPAKSALDPQPANVLKLGEFSPDVEERFAPWLKFVRSSLDEVGQVPDLNQRFVFALAESARTNNFWFILSRAFGSQIDLLKRLHYAKKSDVDKSMIFFDEHCKRAGAAALDFDVWLGFLVNARLVQREGDEIQITKIGEDFFDFLVAQQELERYRPF